jgi:Ca2+/H+ antiporter, TMEM165/GDT1 family
LLDQALESKVGLRAAGPIGTEHAPVDGKDGMPHEGPWIQTETDRKNQKSKDSDGEEVLVYSSKTTSTFTTDMPQFNDGVMDDRNRKSPQEGTRGTEGGVSEKSKDGQIVEKKPEQPKEAPPLPHSETEKMKSTQEDEAKKVSEDGSKKPYTVGRSSPVECYC